MKRIVIIAGPNGAGKTTFGLQYQAAEPELDGVKFLNADEIERELSSDLPQNQRNREATEIIIRRMKELVEQGHSFMVETTLATRWYAQKIPAWREAGYYVTLIYLRLPDADYAVKRVRRRVANKGHDIPEDVVRRRFRLSSLYLEDLYRAIVDELVIKDNEDEGGSLFAAEDGNG